MEISSNCKLNNSLKQALIDSAMRTFDNFIEEKSDDIVNKYKDDPRYVKACELIKEREQLSIRLTEIKHELDSIISYGHCWITPKDTRRFISNYLAGVIDIRNKLNKEIQDYIEIEINIPCFDPRHLLNKLNEIAKKAISKINI